MTGHPIDRALQELASERRDLGAPNEDTILAYLAGTASELEAREVRAAVLASSEFRDGVARFAEELEELGSKDLARAFDAADPGGAPSMSSVLGEPEQAAPRASLARTSGWDRMRSLLFGRPALAFAVAALLIVIAVPLLRPRPGVVLPGLPAEGAPVLVVRALPQGSLRGDEALRLPEAPAAEDELVLRLEAPAGARPGDLTHVAVSDSGGEVWRSRGPRRFEGIGGEVFLVLAVSPSRLGSGDVSIELVDIAGSPLASYRFRVTDR